MTKDTYSKLCKEFDKIHAEAEKKFDELLKEHDVPYSEWHEITWRRMKSVGDRYRIF